MTQRVSTGHQSRFGVRVKPSAWRKIEKAAAISGQSVSDYASTNLLRAAEETIRTAEVTRLSDRDRDLFLKLISSDQRPNQALRRAAKRYWDRRA